MSTLADPAAYSLPPDYIQNLEPGGGYSGTSEYWTPKRAAENYPYQIHVYRWAARLARSRQDCAVLDIGCGTGLKLERLVAPHCERVVGIDREAPVVPGEARPSFEFISMDLENPGDPAIEPFDVIIAADVIEHLVDPGPLLALILRCAHERTSILISTPDRARLRGRACGACKKEDHVREWARGEFIEFLGARGFRVLRSRLTAQDDTPTRRLLGAEVLYRLGRRERSALCCHAVMCRPD